MERRHRRHATVADQHRHTAVSEERHRRQVEEDVITLGQSSPLGLLAAHFQICDGEESGSGGNSVVPITVPNTKGRYMAF